MSKEQKQTYQEAFEELQTLVQDIENGDISVDVLSEKVKRAAFLIKFCREKLISTEKDVNEVLKDLNEE